jgi:hypothetical protein
MQALAVLAIFPLIGILFIGAMITRDTWIGGTEYKNQ